MLKDIEGIHHVTSLASDANTNNSFFTKVLGLRRVKKTVNFDAPDVYHLYYGDEMGSPGSVMTYFPFPNIGGGSRGNGEVGTTVFSVPTEALGFWEKRLADANVSGLARSDRFGEARLSFKGPDGDDFALVEAGDDNRAPWLVDGIPADVAIRGFHSASLKTPDRGALLELLQFMSHEIAEEKDNLTRLIVDNGNGAHLIDLEETPSGQSAVQGAGSVHHIAFAVADRAAQLRVREALVDTGYAVTPVIDRDYFWAIYFRTPEGILFEIATNEPGFDRDEDTAHLGEALKLPNQHAHMRDYLEKNLAPIHD